MPSLTDPSFRLVAGALIALAISLAARRTRALDASGAAAATILGAVACAAGWSWAALLVIYFVSTSGLSHWRAEAKAARTRGMVEKGGERDAVQVVANGGVFGLAALAHLAWPTELVAAVGAGALAAAAADSWATEIGTLAGGRPRSVTNFRPLDPGASGGVTLAGTGGALVGGVFIALVTRGLAVTVGPTWIAVALAGFAGAMLDSLLGAAVQARRWCPICQTATEQRTHRCGAPTRHAGGVGWLENDAVNLAASAGGALVAAFLVAATR